MRQTEQRFQLRIITEDNLPRLTTAQLNAVRTVAIKATLAVNDAFQDQLTAAGFARRLTYRATHYAGLDAFYLFDVHPATPPEKNGD